MELIFRHNITNWWVARSNSKMAFFNILSKKEINENDQLLVVGYLDGNKNEGLYTSQHYVVKVTSEGVITEKGSFYPFTDANKLYLQFIIDANQKNTLIATNWAYYNNKKTLIADIIRGEDLEESIFDFNSYEGVENLICRGYSDKLSSNIVVTTFARRNVCIAIAIPKNVKDDIYTSSCLVYKGKIGQVEQIQQIYSKKFY